MTRAMEEEGTIGVPLKTPSPAGSRLLPRESLCLPRHPSAAQSAITKGPAGNNLPENLLVG